MPKFNKKLDLDEIDLIATGLAYLERSTVNLGSANIPTVEDMELSIKGTLSPDADATELRRQAQSARQQIADQVHEAQMRGEAILGLRFKMLQWRDSIVAADALAE